MQIRPPTKYAVIDDFKQALNEAHEILLYSDKDIGRMINLRCSQLPFCPTSLLLNTQNQGMVQSQDLMGAYYTSVGHVVHSAFQSYLAKTGKFIADYYCKPCKKWHRTTTYKECKKCGGPTEYHELLISYKGIVGHIDAVFKDRNGKYWIVDFKTCSLANSDAKTLNPGPEYQEQIESYAYLLWKQYGILVEGVMLCFIPRDNPKQAKFYTQEVDKRKLKEIRNRLQNYKRLHKLAMKASTAKDVWAIAKTYRCPKPYCKYCSLSDESLKVQIKRAFKRPLILPLEKLKLEHTKHG